MARSPASRSGNNSASSAACSGRSITIEYFDQLERLRNDYYYFSPDRDDSVRFDRATVDRVYRDLIEAFTRVLHGANFVEVPHDEIQRAHREHGIVASTSRRRSKITARSAFSAAGITVRRSNLHMVRARKRSVEFGVYDDVVLLAAMKPTIPPPPTARSAPQAKGAAGRGAAEIFPRHRQRRPQCAVS